MKLFVPVSQTGGVGKSTYAWNLAWRLAKRYPGSRVLFMDATKNQGTRSMRVCPEEEIAGRGLGKALNVLFSVMDPETPTYKMQDEIEDALARAHKVLVDCMIPVYGDMQKSLRIDLLPAAAARIHRVIETKWYEPEEGVMLRKLLDSIASRYDFAVVDVTPDIGCKSVRSLLRSADGVLGIESVVSEDTIQGIGSLLATMEDTGASFNGFVGNMMNWNLEEPRRALKVLLDACELTGKPLLQLVEDYGSIANTTRIHHTDKGEVVSGLYAEMPVGRRDPSIRKALTVFEAALDRLIDVMNEDTVCDITETTRMRLREEAPKLFLEESAV